MNNERDCKHGQLARSCEICGLVAENAALKVTISHLELDYQTECAAVAALGAELAAMREQEPAAFFIPARVDVFGKVHYWEQVLDKTKTPLYAAPGASPQPKNASGQWMMIAPDGKEFTGETPLKAAFPASKYRLEIDPVAAAKFAEVIEQQRAEGEAEHERCMRDYGTLACPACGGSGHIADAMAAQPSQARDDWISSSQRHPDKKHGMFVLVGYEDGCVEITRSEYVMDKPDLYPFWQQLPSAPKP